MIASKYSEDHYFSNKHYSKVGGISQEDIDMLEKEFLRTIDYNLFVSQEELANYAEKLDTFYEMLNPLHKPNNNSTSCPPTQPPQDQQT